MECSTTAIFGAPRGTLGRDSTPIAAIAIHGVKNTYEGLLSKMCNSSLRMQEGCHSSFHYVIDGESGRVSSVVPVADLAWAFQDYRTNFPIKYPVDHCPCPPPCPTPPCTQVPSTTEIDYPGWTTLHTLHPHLSADFYAINIGIAIPNRPEQVSLDGTCEHCLGPWGLSEAAYASLVRLIAWLEFTYTITNDAQHVNFHDNIVVRDQECLEFQCPSLGACLVCDVSHYCEKCNNPGDPTISVTGSNIRYIYGENDSGCKVKILLDDLKVLLA